MNSLTPEDKSLSQSNVAVGWLYVFDDVEKDGLHNDDFPKLRY